MLFYHFRSFSIIVKDSIVEFLDDPVLCGPSVSITQYNGRRRSVHNTALYSGLETLSGTASEPILLLCNVCMCITQGCDSCHVITYAAIWPV